MTTNKKPPFRAAIVGIIAVLAMAGVAMAAWTFSLVDHKASGSHSESFTVNCEYDKFRKIMIRKNATRAMVDQSGMRLISESIDDLEVDTSKDDRPLLNAIRGKSKSELSAAKRLTVEINDPAIDATELKLLQQAEINGDSMNVETKSVAPAGNLKRYQTNLTARADGDQTVVDVKIAMDVVVQVPKMFTQRADDEVQKSAEEAVAEQRESLMTFVAEHADKRVILPELKK